MISVHYINNRDTHGRDGQPYLDALGATVEAASQYTVETDLDAVRELRSTLAQANNRINALSNAASGSTPAEITSDLRGILRKYRDRAGQYIERLRHDVKSASEALESLLSTMQNATSETGEMLTREIQHLRSLLSSNSLEELRAGVEQSAHMLAECADKVCREKDSVIAQLKSEMQILHRNLDEAQRAAKLDPLTGMVRKDEFFRLVRRSVVAGEPVGIICVWLQNLHELAGEYPAAVAEIRGAFSRRVHNVISGATQAGEWEQSSFCILCPQDCICSTAARVERASSGRYVYMREASSQIFNLKAVISCLKPEVGEHADGFLNRLSSGIGAGRKPV